MRPSTYAIRELSEAEFKPLFDQYKKTVFEDTHSYDLRDVLSDAEQERIAELGKGRDTHYKLNLGVFDKANNFVGWSWGHQEGPSTFYMTNSAILPEHRRKGLYRALLKRSLEVLTAKGFQLIYSRHCATNNNVIIPKLQAGFIISKMEIDDRFGVLIHLHFYTNRNRRKIMDYRAGQSKLDAKAKAAFGGS